MSELSTTTATSPSALAGQRALVTGASRGIGRAIATAFAAAGADLVLSGRDVTELEEAAQQLREDQGVTAEVVRADLLDPEGPAQLAREAWEVAGGLHVLVNNAGISHPQPVIDTDPQLWDEVTTVNLRAPALLAARLGRAMAEAGEGGAIVNVASTAGLRALAEHYSYCATKAGLIMATKVLALELGHAGVRANVVCPTIVMTEMGQQVWGEQEKAAPMLARIPTGRFAAPEEVADAVVFLASPAAAMLNGVEFPIDGGFTVS